MSEVQSEKEFRDYVDRMASVRREPGVPGESPHPPTLPSPATPTNTPQAPADSGQKLFPKTPHHSHAPHAAPRETPHTAAADNSPPPTVQQTLTHSYTYPFSFLFNLVENHRTKCPASHRKNPKGSPPGLCLPHRRAIRTALQNLTRRRLPLDQREHRLDLRQLLRRHHPIIPGSRAPILPPLRIRHDLHQLS